MVTVLILSHLLRVTQPLRGGRLSPECLMPLSSPPKDDTQLVCPLVSREQESLYISKIAQIPRKTRRVCLYPSVPSWPVRSPSPTLFL